MLKWFLIAGIAVLSLADNPKIYSGLGNVIYDDMESISRLSDIKAMAKYNDSIAAYLEKCRAVRKSGFALEKNQPTPAETKAYLNSLRSLEKEHAYFLRLTNSALLQTIQNNDYNGYSELIKSGLVDIEKNSEDIVGFYLQNRNEYNALAEVEDFMRYQEELQKRENQEEARRHSLYRSYKQQRIRQIHKRQAEKKAAITKSINDERERTKMEVYKQQEEELQFDK